MGDALHKMWLMCLSDVQLLTTSGMKHNNVAADFLTLNLLCSFTSVKSCPLLLLRGLIFCKYYN